MDVDRFPPRHFLYFLPSPNLRAGWPDNECTFDWIHIEYLKYLFTEDASNFRRSTGL